MFIEKNPVHSKKNPAHSKKSCSLKKVLITKKHVHSKKFCSLQKESCSLKKSYILKKIQITRKNLLTLFLAKKTMLNRKNLPSRSLFFCQKKYCSLKAHCVTLHFLPSIKVVRHYFTIKCYIDILVYWSTKNIRYFGILKISDILIY